MEIHLIFLISLHLWKDFSILYVTEGSFLKENNFLKYISKMSKFKSTPEGFSEAMEWAKTVPHENGKTLYEFISTISSSEEKLSFVNTYYGKSL